MAELMFNIPQDYNKKQQQDWQQYKLLEADDAAVLRVFAIASGPTYVNWVESYFANSARNQPGVVPKLSPIAIRHSIELLTKKRLLTGNTYNPQCDPLLAERICREWFIEPENHKWMTPFTEWNSALLSFEKTMAIRTIHVLRSTLYSGGEFEWDLMQREIASNHQNSSSDFTAALKRICCSPWDVDWFVSLPPFSQAQLLQLLIELSLREAEQIPQCETIINALLSNATSIKEEFLYFVSLYYFLKGEIEKAKKLLTRFASMPIGSHGLLLFMLGDYKQAAEVFEQERAAWCKRIKTKKGSLPDPTHLFHLLALLGTGGEVNKTKFFALAEISSRSKLPAEMAVFRFASWLVKGIPYSYAITRETSPIRALFQLLMDFWGRKEDKEILQIELGRLIEKATNAEQYWVAYQAHIILQQCTGSSRETPSSNWFPLTELYQAEPEWKHVLDALKRIAHPAETPEKVAQSMRLIWSLSDYNGLLYSIHPKEQKLGVNGRWSKGRQASVARLRNDMDNLSYLTEADKYILQTAVNTSAYYENASYDIPLKRALPYLIGHPSLYFGESDLPAEFARGEIRLRVLEQHNALLIHLEPTPPVDLDGDYFVKKETPRRWVVYTVTAAIKQVAKIIGKELKAPTEARESIIETLTSLAPLLSIHSDVAIPGHEVETLTADPQLYAHLLPYSEGIKVQILVRPITEGSWYQPGKGGETVIGELNGKAVQARRDLVQERNALLAFETACFVLTEAENHQGERLLATPELALEFLLQLRELTHLIKPLWPAGKRFNLSRELSENDLSLRINSGQDWFNLSGEVKIDQDRTFQLKQLLALVEASPGRFIQISENEYIALTENLRKQLSEMNGFFDNKEDAVIVPTLGAHLIEGWTQSSSKVEVDATWRERVNQMHFAQALQAEIPSTLDADLRDYQKIGFEWLARMAQWGVGVCLADDMGLGKTVQTLSLLLYRAGGGPALVVAPMSLCTNWQAEANRFAPTLNIHLYHEERKLTDIGAFDVVVISYGLLQSNIADFQSIHWHSLVLDEAQAIKNAQTKRTKAIFNLAADFRLACTGTPIENHLGEIWSLFRYLNPGLLGSSERFNERFVNAIERGDSEAKLRLKRLIQPFILRRTKREVLKELPPKTEIIYSIELSAEEKSLYEATRERAIENINATAKIGKDSRFQILAEITKLRRLCCHPTFVLPDTAIESSKMNALADILDELIENNHKALVFSQFVDVLAKVKTFLDEKHIRYHYLDGSTSMAERKKRVDAFQAGQGDLFLISLKAGGTGLNLTAADYVIHIDPWWNPAVEDQASDRAHRIGQTRPVTIYRLVTKETIEERIMNLHGKKRDLADSLLAEGEIAASVSAEDMMALLKDEIG